MITLSALSKLPDEGKRTSVRAEGSGLPDWVLESWLSASNQGQNYVESLALLSSASEKPSDSFFDESKSKVVMMLSGENGKKIIPWSMFGASEREVLFLPTTLKFQPFIRRDYYGNLLTIIKAKSVSGSIEETSLDNSAKIAQQNISMNKNTSVEQAAIIKKSKI